MGNIEPLSRIDYEEIFALSQFAFQYTLSKEALAEKEQEADRHDIWGYRIDGNLAGKLHIIPLEVLIQGKKFSMGGISSVATWPEYRRSGIAKKLLHHALVKMKEQGQLLAYLHPFSVGFYRKYGWELAFTRRHDTIPTEQFKRGWGSEGLVRRTTKDIETLAEIYTKYANRFHGMLVRDNLWWQQRVLTDKAMSTAIAYDEKGEAVGYIIYKVSNDILTIKEIAYTNMNGRYLLYEFIGNHDSMAGTVKWIVPENNNLPFIVNDPFYEQVNTPYFMARIVDVETFLRQYTYTKQDGIMTLAVEDEFFPENTAVYKVTVSDGQARSVEKIDHTEEAIRCQVQYLSAMCLGYKRPRELLEEELITGSKEAVKQLDSMLPVKQTFLADFF